MSVSNGVLRSVTLAVLVGVGAIDAAAQQGGGPPAIATLRIRVTGELAPLAESGMLTFPGQGPNVVLEAIATDAAGKTVSAARFAPRWATSDENVVSLYSAPAGPSMRIVAQQDGRATVTVTAAGKTASIPVAVGDARLAIAASELAPAFRVARLEVAERQPGDEPKLSGRAILLGENGDQAILGARAYAADGREIPLEHFPVTWTSTDATVVELIQTFEAQTRVVGRESGRTTVSASIQGTSVAIEAFVGDSRADADGSVLSQEPVATAAAPTTTAAASPASATTTTTSTAAPTTTAVTTSAPVTGTVAPTPTTTTATTTAPITSGTPIQGETAGGAVTATTTQAPETMATSDRSSAGLSASLAAPTGLMAKYVGAGRFAFRWNSAGGATPGVTEYELWVKANECPTLCRVTMAGLTDTLHTPLNTFDYTGQMTVHVRAVEAGRDPSPNSVPVALPPTPRYKGVYRITATGLRVNHETTDNPLEIDGKRDEVLVRAKGELFWKGQPLAGTGFFVESKVHGDRNAVAWSNATSPTVRIKAGTASLLGGLKTGDEHRSPPGTAPNTISFPLIIWEGSLRESSARVVFVPTIWEVDRAPDWTLLALPEPERDLVEALGRYVSATVSPTLERTYVSTGFNEVRHYYRNALDDLPDWAIEAAMRAGALPPMPMVPGHIRADSVDDALRAEAVRIRAELADLGGTEAAEATTWASSSLDKLLNLYATWAPRLAALLNNEDRPIGIYAQDGQQRLDAQLIHLGFKDAERLANSAEEIQVRYVDKIGGGDYTLFLRVERLE